MFDLIKWLVQIHRRTVSIESKRRKEGRVIIEINAQMNPAGTLVYPSFASSKFAGELKRIFIRIACGMRMVQKHAEHFFIGQHFGRNCRKKILITKY